MSSKYTLLLLLLLLFSPTAALAQDTDVLLFHQLINDNEVEFDKENGTRNAQVTVTATEETNRSKIKQLQEQYTRLQARFNALGIVLDVGIIALIAKPLVSEIIRKQSEIIRLAGSDLFLLPLAIQAEIDMVKRAEKLIRYVTVLILVGGKLQKMKTSDRKELLNHVITELKALKGLSVALARAMGQAKKNKKSGNMPFSSYVNQDRKLAKDIVRNYKALKK